MAKALQRPTTDERPLVFVSYSKDDRFWLDGYLLRHLGALEQEGLITAWTPTLTSTSAVNGFQPSSRR
jgi:hypothetical protein